jgi:hypothetical protein
MIVTRRSILAGAGAAILSSGAKAQASADATLRTILDASEKTDAPAIMADRLSRVDPASLSPSARADLITALSGLRIDAQLADRFPNAAAMSAARYRLLLRRITSDDADPGALMRRLDAERGVLTDRADRLMKRLDRATGTVGARYSAMWSDPEWLYSDDDAGRDRAVADMNRTLAAARLQALRDYPAIPAHCFHVSVRRMGAADEAAGRGGYRDLPTATTAGAYVVDLKHIRRRPGWTLPSVVRHETLPGHMIQLPIEAAAAPHPLRIRYAPGFAEGWAIHAERVALVQGVYVADPMAELGCIHWLLFRVGRALADLHIHLSGWTRADALRHLVDWQGEPAYFAPFDVDIDRIVKDPGARVAEAAAWFALDDLWRRKGGWDALQPPRSGRVRNDRLADWMG